MWPNRVRVEGCNNLRLNLSQCLLSVKFSSQALEQSLAIRFKLDQGSRVIAGADGCHLVLEYSSTAWLFFRLQEADWEDSLNQDF